MIEGERDSLRAPPRRCACGWPGSRSAPATPPPGRAGRAPADAASRTAGAPRRSPTAAPPRDGRRAAGLVGVGAHDPLRRVQPERDAGQDRAEAVVQLVAQPASLVLARVEHAVHALAQVAGQPAGVQRRAGVPGVGEQDLALGLPDRRAGPAPARDQLRRPGSPGTSAGTTAARRPGCPMPPAGGRARRARSRTRRRTAATGPPAPRPWRRAAPRPSARTPCGRRGPTRCRSGPACRTVATAPTPDAVWPERAHGRWWTTPYTLRKQNRRNMPCPDTSERVRGSPRTDADQGRTVGCPKGNRRPAGAPYRDTSG